MGCIASSAPQVSPQARRKQQDMMMNSKQEKEEKSADVDSNSVVLHDAVSTIIKGISKIPKPPNLHPLVCLNEFTTPVAIAIISLSSGNTTEIYLPVVAISIFDHRRTLVLGQIELLSLCVTANTEASAFLENSIRWTGGMGRNNYRILLLQIEPNLAEIISANLKGFDFITEIKEKPPDQLRYHTIVTTMQCKYSDILRDFKGGLIVADVSEETQNEKMVKFVSEMGIGFPNFSLSIGNVQSEFVRTNKVFKELHECTLLKLIKSYKTMTQDESDMSVQKYDNLVTGLRYHLICLPRAAKNEHLLELGISAYELLKNTNYITYINDNEDEYDSENNDNNNTDDNDDKDENDNNENDKNKENEDDNNVAIRDNKNNKKNKNSMICPTIIHGITAVLLTELLSRLPASAFKDQHFGSRFPGEYENPVLGDFKTHHEFLCEGWSSSGLYCPSGVIGHATLSKRMKGVSIQVGSHSECTLSQTGPWRRWPIIFETFNFDDNEDKTEIDFGSPFGGIVYVVVNDIIGDLDSTNAISLDVTFRNMAPYPLYTSSDPSLWESVKDEPAPWTEIETQFIILTIPSEKTHLFGDLAEYCEFIDNLIAEVLQFTSDNSQKLFRLVFDVELPNDKATCNYPISMPMRCLESIAQKNPTVDLFLLLYYIATLSIAQMNFGEVDRYSLGMVAASHSFKTAFKGVHPLEYNAETPPELFHDLWTIYTCHKPDDFTRAFMSIRMMYELAPVDEKKVWELFVQKISEFSGKDHSPKLLQNKEESGGAGTVLVSYSSRSLSEFQLPDGLRKEIESKLVPTVEE